MALTLKLNPSSLLDETSKAILGGDTHRGMDLLVDGLKALRSTLPESEWRRFSDTDLLQHPIAEIIWQDPFTRHSYTKPRGYPGDAELLDYIYGISVPPEHTSLLGREIFNYAINGQACLSVRSRRDILTEFIDETVARFDKPHIFSIACGHLREAHRSKAVTTGKVGRFTVLDQDAQSLSHVQSIMLGQSIHTVNGSLSALFSRKARFNGIHFVYAAGLYDYLADKVAGRLTRLMFDMIIPGGRVLVANFAPSLRDIGYMETFMGWRLIYRNEDDMKRLAALIPRDQVQGMNLFRDQHKNIVFLEVTKK